MKMRRLALRAARLAWRLKPQLQKHKAPLRGLMGSPPPNSKNRNLGEAEGAGEISYLILATAKS